jgi:hypothetical protein
MNFYNGYWGYYWGHELKEKIAWFPVKTDDCGWIWLRRYYLFRTNTGYGHYGWKWEIHRKSKEYSDAKFYLDKYIKLEKYKNSKYPDLEALIFD